MPRVGRCLAGVELLLAQGFAGTPELGRLLQVPQLLGTQGSSHTAAAKWAGNAMHTSAVGSVLLWISVFGRQASVSRPTEPDVTMSQGDLCRQLTAGFCKLRDLPDHLKLEKSIVLAGVAAHGHSLGSLGVLWKRDRDVVLAAVRQNGLALRHAHPLRKDDDVVVAAAVASRGLAIRFASLRLRCCPRIQEIAVYSDPKSFVFFGRSAREARPSFREHDVKSQPETVSWLSDIADQLDNAFTDFKAELDAYVGTTHRDEHLAPGRQRDIFPLPPLPAGDGQGLIPDTEWISSVDRHLAMRFATFPLCL